MEKSARTKILLLNLPAKEQITRRYMCSYPSPESLLPPVELLSCAAVARERSGAEAYLLDAVAEKKSLSDVAGYIADLRPNFVLTLSGFECYEDDIDAARFLKNHLPQAVWIWFGHYATIFPEETLRHSNADYVILGEPEQVLENLLRDGALGVNAPSIPGLAALKEGKLQSMGVAPRIMDPNELPMPAYDLMPAGDKYYEPLIDKPYAMIQTMRGCPYRCNYCVKSYGSKLAQLTSDRVIQEIKTLKRLRGIRAIRFIDDTFTVNKTRVTEICQKLISEKLNVEWVCLSRTDNLDEELVVAMKKAGCRRIYFGVESGSQRMIDILGKGLDAKEAMNTLLMVRKHGIETAGFFLSGHPEERDEDFYETIRFAFHSKLNFASFNPLQPYPGTPFFERVKDKINFSIYPYKCEWKDPNISQVFDRRKVIFYSRFYLRLAFLRLNAKLVVRYTRNIPEMAGNILRYVFWDRRFVIGGIKTQKEL